MSLLFFGMPFFSSSGSYLSFQFLFAGSGLTAGGVAFGVGRAGECGGKGGGSLGTYDWTRDTCGRGGRLCLVPTGGEGNTGGDEHNAVGVWLPECSK